MSIEFLLTSLVVVLMPGTGVLFTVATGLFQGSRASLFAAVGCTLGIVPSLIASVTGLALVIHTSAVAFQIVKFVGVAYLLFLAWGMLRNSGPLNVTGEAVQDGGLSIALKGFLINILNPKLTIFFLAFLPQFVPVESSAPTQVMAQLGAVFMLMTMIVFSVYGLLATSLRSHVIQSQCVSTLLQRLFAGGFALLGVRLALASREA